MMIHPKYIYLLCLMVLTIVSIATPLVVQVTIEVIILWAATAFLWLTYFIPKRKK